MLESRDPSVGQQVLLFARNFLKHPRMLGSVIPSSRFLVDQLLRQVDWARARVIVEFGPGVGTFTREVLRRMRPDAHLIVIEMNRDFVKLLEESATRDPRLTVVHGSAADIDSILGRCGEEMADVVISGIPFSTIPEEARREIVRKTWASLRNGGDFLVYQFSGEVLPYLRERFRAVRRDFEPLNILPARLFYCRKG